MTASAPRPAYAYVDHERLLADLAADDQAAVAHAYAQVFGSELGQLVLVHQLSQAGVAIPRPADADALTRAHSDGEACHALRIAHFAGFDNFSVALALTTGRLEGRKHERRSRDDHHDQPRDEFGSPDPDARF